MITEYIIDANSSGLCRYGSIADYLNSLARWNHVDLFRAHRTVTVRDLDRELERLPHPQVDDPRNEPSVIVHKLVWSFVDSSVVLCWEAYRTLMYVQMTHTEYNWIMNEIDKP